jgi:hypothetical protein
MSVAARGRFSMAARRFVLPAGVIRAVRFWGVFTGIRALSDE